MYCCKVFQRQNPKFLSNTVKTLVSSQQWNHNQASSKDAIPKQTTRSKVTGIADHFSGNASVDLPKSALNNESNLDFEDFQKAFMGKSTREILRALMVYKLCSFDFLVERNKALIKISRTLLGKRGFEFLMKNSFYGHFVAGETQEEIKSYLSLMKAYGVGAILDYAVEADIPQSTIEESSTTDKIHEEEDEVSLENLKEKFKVHMDFADRRQDVISARTYFYEGEEKCDENMEVFLKCIDTTSNTSENGFAAIKVTALGRPVLLLRLSQILNQTQVYFDLLAENKGNCITERSFAEDTFERGLKDLGVEMTSAEVKQVFDIIDTSNDGKIDIHEWHSFLTPRLKLARLFRAKPVKKGEKGGEVLSTLTDAELKEMENMTDRLLTVAQRAKDKNVRLMVDAEQTYFQPAISRITLEAMRVFNKDKPTIFNTYQCYLKDTPANLRIDMELARREGFKFACKLVRGAYMEQERARAEAHGYPDPIHDNKENTHACYNDMLYMMLEEVRDRGANVMTASHNEASVRHAIKTMKEFGIKRTDDNVFFGQLLGMCDAITYALGGAGYAAYKYVPYGPVEDVIPYLSRRAMENKSVMLGVMKERQMLWNELVRRSKTGSLAHDPWAHINA